MSMNENGKSASPVTLASIREMKARGEKFTCLTAYDATFARIFDAAGVEVLLVGDSLGMVIQGRETTLPVTLDEMIYHTACVSRARKRALIMADMPFMSDARPHEALRNAARLMAEGGAHMVKIEGGAVMAETIQRLDERGIPVCAHLGLLPQSVHKIGGYRVQGRDGPTARRILEDAATLTAAGADMLLLECVPATLADEIVASVKVPVIGIGASAACDAQVLVCYDMLGLTPGPRPRFCENFLAGRDTIQAAVQDYVQAVKTGRFPASEHLYA